MTLTNVMQPRCPITDVTTIAERLKEARLELKLSQKELATRAGVSAGTIGNLEAGARGEPRKLLEIAAAAGVTPEWLKHGKPPKQPSNWTPPQYASQGVSVHPVAQDLTHPENDDEPTTCTWEFIVSAVIPLPPRFRLAMPDDALAPRTPRGTWLHFRTDVTPAYGHGVLVQDAIGGRHVRRYTQGPGGRWMAEASQAGYLTLDSADGLQLLAVVVARETGEV